MQQARGVDPFKYHEHAQRTIKLMNGDDVALRNKANDELSKIFYHKAGKKGKY